MNYLRRIIIMAALLCLLGATLFPPMRYLDSTQLPPHGFLFSEHFYQADIHYTGPGSYYSKAVTIDSARLLLTWAFFALVAAVSVLCTPTSKTKPRDNHHA
jgi:hypothetical protein